MSSIAFEREYDDYCDFARTVDRSIIISFTRRSTMNNVDGSNIHIKNQVELNEQCIASTVGSTVGVHRMHYTAPQNGFTSYSNKSYAKRLVEHVRRLPKGSLVTIILSSLGRLSREWSVIKKMQDKLVGYEVYLQFSQSKYEKSLLKYSHGIDYKVVKLKNVKESDLKQYKDEVINRKNANQQRKIALAIGLQNLGYSQRQACKMLGIDNRGIAVYQLQNKHTSKVYKGKVDRQKRSQKVLKMSALGKSAREIADATSYTIRNVYKILQKNREALASVVSLRSTNSITSLPTSEKVLKSNRKEDIEKAIKSNLHLFTKEQRKVIEQYLRL